MTLNDAVAKRVSNLLRERGMKQYGLEKKSGIQHGSLQCIMKGKNKTVTISTIYMLARGFDMSHVEFLNDPIFFDDDLEIE
ncbi:MAG: helix-turn-helix transcriptional regulator [Clostridiales bacterium]|nr:helix-turn-helix transcriptional regulator [Clostridiales bacterium]